jgi:SP family myo-inositol transporter-like MFS transporter 13
MKGITPTGAFSLYAGICFLGWILVILFFPEVAQLPLEDVREVFTDGFGVKKANLLRKKEKWREENRNGVWEDRRDV